MGRHHKKGRKVNGILLLDKPMGVTSNEALQEVKRLYRARKAGHTGSLDPLATGLLPVCFGEATKVSSFLLDANKRYRMTCQLGSKTATGDAEGEVVEQAAVPELNAARLSAVLSRFTGRIEQIPPMYSALKHQGQRLYNLARQGVEVERAAREVQIHALDLLQVTQSEIELDVLCSKGTYVRTLAEDIAVALGTVGHVSALRRTGVGPYQNPEPMWSVQELRHYAADGQEALDALLLPIESALLEWPRVSLGADMAYYLRQGQAVVVPHAPTQGWVRLYGDAEQFLGMGEVQDDGKVAPRRLFAVG